VKGENNNSMKSFNKIMMLSALVLGAEMFNCSLPNFNNDLPRPDFKTTNPKKKSRKAHFKRNNKKRGK